MSNVNYLNVDALIPVKKQITIFDVTYDMHVVNVGEFLELTTASKEVDEESFDSLPVNKQVLKLIDNVLIAFPEVPPEVLKQLTVEQLTAIVKFIAGILEEEVEANAAIKDELGDEKNA
jgi:hypothetical protein